VTAVAGAAARGASFTEQIAERVREAAVRPLPLRVAGRGHWLDAGRPVAAREVLSLEAATGIVDYTPGDLTLTARAGTTLAEIASATAAERQWLALDPPGPLTGTIGATAATASSGPLAHAFGTPRDATLGLEVVTGEGKIVRTGGRVVKNVAGFDLTRLFVGSWGTLGVITEVTVRLRALPEVEETLSLPIRDDPASLDALLTTLRAAALTPLALELLNAPLAAMLGVGDGTRLLIRLGGNADSVHAQHHLVTTLGNATTVPGDVWATLRNVEPAGAWVSRVSCAPARLGSAWIEIGRAAADTGLLAHATLGRGIIRCILPPGNDDRIETFLSLANPFQGTTIFERLPRGQWPAARLSPAHESLSRAIKHTFDPMRILNPGILGEGT
jgi:glycolate oxidase FAD binding subunit